ncbi:MAG: hypothetical protein JRG69_04395 [Deltaproteobacteria bacterium]|nr:hypothetical protein [Deltaproteobacteria bacterium]
MDIQWWEIVGLIGVTLVFSAGRIFEPLREWLSGFQNAWSPFSVLGDLLHCSMCCGVWIGFLWAFFAEGWPWYAALVFGGCISIASLVTDELVGIIALYRLLRKKKNQGAMTMDEMVATRQQMAEVKKRRAGEKMAKERARRRGTPRDLTEEEADARADAEDDAVDALILGDE